MESTVQSNDVAKKPEVADADITKIGNNLLLKFHALLRMSRTYDSKNVALVQFIQESLKMINSFIEREGSFSLKIIRDDLYMNQQRLRYSVEGFNSFKYLLVQWKKRAIGEVIFKEPVDERMLRAFIYTLVDLEEGGEGNATRFNETMKQEGISAIHVNSLETFEGEDGVYTLRKGDL